MQLVILTGMSGAGKTCALRAMEDMGYFCTDNLPPQLLNEFARLRFDRQGERAAVAIDARGGSLFNVNLIRQFMQASHPGGAQPMLLFIDASDKCLAKRYEESGSAHPMARNCSLSEAIARERTAVEPLRQCASQVIDTTALTADELRARLEDMLKADDASDGEMQVDVISFGFKHGLPENADMVLDVRILPNPYYVPDMRARTGRDEDVRRYVLDGGDAHEFMDKARGMLEFLLPRYAKTGRARFTLAVGCTGGQHRSVAVADALGEFICAQGYRVQVEHRDMAASREAEKRLISRTSGG